MSPAAPPPPEQPREGGTGLAPRPAVGTLSRATPAPPSQRNRKRCPQCSRRYGDRSQAGFPQQDGRGAAGQPTPTHLKASALCTQTRILQTHLL